ncbi:MAG: hypothetical protein DRG80_06635, partial [Deltaproteobacteria bacterium]
MFIVDDKNYAQSAQAITGTMPLSAQGEVVATSGSTLVQAPPMVVETSNATGTQVAVPVIEQVGSKGKVYTGEKTSLVFDNADVRDILRLIAEISDLNLIASDQVKGNITLRLIDVPWDQALDLILDVTGLGMIQERNVVRVLPKETIRAMKESELTAEHTQEKIEPLVTEVIPVNYAGLGDVSV